MIEKLRWRLIRISLFALIGAMLSVTLAINGINWLNVRSELHETLKIYADSGGNLGKAIKGRSKHMKNLVTLSTCYVARVDEDGGTRIIAGQGQASGEIQELMQSLAENGSTEGIAGDYLYARFTDKSGSYLAVMDAESSLTRVRRLGVFSAVACLTGIIAAAVFVMLFSKKMMKPFVENERQQKQFITDASHELKTPLTVISANMDLLSIDLPENTWIDSTQKQVSQMRHMVDEMVYLSRLEESVQPEMQSVDLGKLAQEAAEPFAAMAEFQGRKLIVEADHAIVRGNPEMLERLCSVLLDNAVKYTAEHGEILFAVRQDRMVTVYTENIPLEPLDEAMCAHLFDRFYRADHARSKGRKGYGIGLAIAQAIVQKHGGEARAEKRGNVLRIACVLPAEKERK